jgi:general secretion pathway protein L
VSVLNLNKNVTIEIKPFLRWWARELAFLVPIKIRQFFHTPQAAIIVRSKGEQFELSYEINGEQKYLATVVRDISKAQAVKNLLAGERFKNAVFVLRLSNADALSKTVNLPLAAQANVTQVVSYELDRYSPFKAEQVYFATRIERVDTEAAQLAVQLLLTPKKHLESLYNDCKNLGITPSVVDVEDSPNDLQNLHSAYNLLPQNLQLKVKNTSRWIIGALFISLILLSFSSLVLPVWLEYQAVEELENKISKIDKEVKAIKNLQAEMDSLREETQLLINEKTAAPPIIVILNEISALMQDDSWLSYLQYSDGQIQLQGESKAASNLLADLEASDYFAKVNFASPVTQDKASGLERFQITAEITKPDNPENSDVTTDTTVEPISESNQNVSDDSPVETTVEDVTTEEVVTEDGTPEEQPK